MTSKLKTEGLSSFAEAAAQYTKLGYWPTHRRDGLHIFVNYDGDAVAFARDGNGLYHVTRDFPIDQPMFNEESTMSHETNNEITTSTAATAKTPMTSDVVDKAAPTKKTASGSKPAATTGGKGGSKAAGKMAAQTTSGAQKSAKSGSKDAKKVAKPSVASKKTGRVPQKAASTTAKKAGSTPAAQKGSSKRGSEAHPGQPRAGSGANLVLRMAKAGKTDEEILAAAKKELPKVRSVNDPRGVAWYRWQLKKNGLL